MVFVTESAYVARLLRTAVAQGWTILDVDNGEYRVKIDGHHNSDIRKALEEAKATDMAHIAMNRNNEHGVFFLVWQDPSDKEADCAAEVLNNWSASLETVVDSLNSRIGA